MDDNNVPRALELSHILREVIRAAANRDFDRVEEAAEGLKTWARSAAKSLVAGTETDTK